MQERNEHLMSVQEAAEYLAVSVRTIWKYLHTRKLTGVKHMNRTFVSSAELETFGREPESYDPTRHVIVDKETWTRVLDGVKSGSEYAAQMGHRIGQLESEKRQLEDTVKLLEDKRKRPWWRRWKSS